ncbi:MAG: NADH:ubiquinone oxidoreductase subunit F (NADH-binding) [Chlamydiales bacterium]|jgi:NADH:ubiquinone oxidoreductase subunit F (NADH-binding)
MGRTGGGLLSCATGGRGEATTHALNQEQRASSVPDRLRDSGGLLDGIAREVARETGVPEADVFGVGSFYHLLARPDAKIRVCTGLSCALAGADEILKAARAAGLPSEGCSCLAGCDLPPAVLRDRRVLPQITITDMQRTDGAWEKLDSSAAPGSANWRGAVGPTDVASEELVLDLDGEHAPPGRAFARAMEMGPERVVEAIEAAGLQGRGGAGFPAHIKWRGVQGQAVTTRYVVLNADEGEPGTFKDREVLLRRPDLILEGLAIAAHAVGASEVYLYLRGEFEIPWEIMSAAIARAQEHDVYGDIRFHMHAGNGAYICGEETALLEALEGKRGMPRLKPPFPVEVGLWGKPTLMHNVETIACVPAIVERGGAWFKALGRKEAGTKLYCISGHVVRPGTYELPLGVTLDELVEAAGGYVGELKAFSPGGASSGFLPASERERPLDFRSLAEVGSMLGSAGVVVLNDTVDMRWAALQQLKFFEDESCGQCAPCRIGTRYLHESLRKQSQGGSIGAPLEHVAEAAWQMNEGSICGLGQAAPLPLTSALKYFPEDFAGLDEGSDA